MPIELNCTCGRPLRLANHLAGRAIRCPSCANVLHVPMVAELVEEVAAPPPTVPLRESTRAGPPPLPPVLERESEPIDEPIDKPKKRRRRRRSSYWDHASEDRNAGYSEPSDPADWLDNLNAGVLGGAASILLGLLLFFLLVPFGLISGWSVVLIVVGVAAIIKGMFNSS